MLNQTYFEMADVPASASRTWIPLRENSDVDLDTPADLISASVFTGVATLAVYAGQSENAGRLDWSDLNLQPHRAHVWTDGYHPADIYLDNRFEEPLGINLVIDQDLEGAADGVWHLHSDVVLALRLSRDGDTWFRPEEGWVEVIRLIREDDRPVRLEIRAEFLADYLAARSMTLYLSSYHERIVVTPSAPTFSWPEEGFALEKGRDTHEGRIATQRNLGVPGEGFRIAGALWRTEWFEPGDFSPRVRGDPDPIPSLSRPAREATACRLTGCSEVSTGCISSRVWPAICCATAAAGCAGPAPRRACSALPRPRCISASTPRG
ncbi:hypothetical protein [Brevundimonas variabilis]|uniref:Uncharacterized protein n=1 Tax=Brevundimonas variabilis TaxID=74312 RepID=A0A7W9CK60_9CAUL|nr:hypothetical protein [Brevundimonas variabilis]MBB5747046.1 hypothetical protein [Brevundimonas variabilis]